MSESSDLIVTQPLQNFDRDLGENLGEFLAGEIAEISARSQRDLKILATKNSPRFSPRSRRDLKISSRFSPRSWRDLKISAAKNSSRSSPRSQNLVDIPAEISARSQNLGGQGLTVKLTN